MGLREIAAIALEASRVAVALPFVEAARRSLGPRAAVARSRSIGSWQRRRDSATRLRFRRIIGAIDRRLPGGANCYRRSLIEVALDRGAAGEQLLMGFMRGGSPRSGHAWLESHPAPDDRYDAVMVL